MKTLQQQHYDEFQERLAELSRSLRLQWPAPAEARDEEVGVTAYRKWTVGPPVLVVGVACSLRLLPVLRKHGYRLTLRRADTGEEVVRKRVVGHLSVEVLNLADGEYTLELSLRRSTGDPVLGKLPLKQMAAQPAPDANPPPIFYEIVATFHSPAEDAAEEGTRSAELRRSRNGLLSLWITLKGAAAEGRMARFTFQGPLDGEKWQGSGFVGTDEHGVGEIELRAFDDRLEGKLSRDCLLSLEPVWPEDLKPSDHSLLERSRDAAVIGRAALQTALDRLNEALAAALERLRDVGTAEEVRNACAEALGRFGSAEALAALAERLHDPDTPDRVRRACAEALGSLGSKPRL